jgi:FG-GAP-like repeat
MRRGFCVYSFGIACAVLFSHRSQAQWQFIPGPARSVAKGPTYIAQADFNDDGIPDVVVSSALSPSVTALFVLPDGDFQTVINVVLPTGVALRGVTAGAFYGQKTAGGHAINDIAVVDNAGARVFVIPGNGNGTFGPVPTPGVIPVDLKGPLDIATGSFTNQGNADLVTANGPANTVTPLYNSWSNSGQKTLFTRQLSLPVVPNASAIATADFNGDDIADVAVLAAGGTGAGSVSILLSGNAGLGTPVAVNYTVGIGAVGLTVVNSSGGPDIAVINQGTKSNPSISILRNLGTGLFDVPSPIPLSCPKQNGVVLACTAQGITSEDFDGDGVDDLAVSFSTSGASPGFVSFYKGFADGSFPFATQVALGGAPRRLIAADFTGDGVPDVAVTEYGTNAVRILQGACSNLPGAGCTPRPTSTPTATQTRTHQIATATQTPTPQSTPTATPTPKSCTPACSGGLVCNTDAGVCCNLDTCPLDQRCDITGAIGTCSDLLVENQPCKVHTDCKSDRCLSTLVCGPSLAPATPTATPTKEGGPITSDTPGDSNVIPTVTRSGGCSIGERTVAGGAWMLAALPVAFWARRFRRQHAHALRRDRPRVQ